MANPLDRTWYNTLVDDDGSGNVGTVWNKAAVNSLLASVDASLAALVDKAGAPGVANELPLFVDADTIKGGSGVASLGSGVLGLNSLPGADSGALSLSGAGGYNRTRGAFIYVAGNQFGAPGFINLQMGDVPGAAISFGGTAGAPVCQMTAGGVIVVSGGALQFPATQKPSTDPNTLDDYREGKWSPTIGGTSGASGQTYAAQRGAHLKFGRYGILTFEVALAALGTITGAVTIGNLPFQTDTAEYWVQFCQLDWANMAAGFIKMSGYVEPSLPSAIRVVGIKAAATTSLTPLVQADLTAASSLMGTLIYRQNF